ncbi:SPOR domain-containing protein [Aquisalimonas lutea]|uniref:SPOR domain-containing protein n=1 Tax=Aquisalimonas lutea TaxID=1327750 RepID=UPI0025B5FFD6|nr:SPOR domain-containing protein [Aquisalimonas lutea]MDN3517758.1 SPOR domain-containing protein [Aquisalimonas lutea]
MQQHHKQRLIGAVVVVALAVVFLPMLLQGPVDRSTTDMSMDIPPRPEAGSGDSAGQDARRPADTLEAVPLPEDTDTGDTGTTGAQDAPPPEPSVQAAEPGGGEAGETAEAGPAPAEGEGDTEPRGDEDAAWAVQVGSFSQRDNALGLRDRLRDQEFSAYVDRVERDGEPPLYRLRVGPVIQREDAEALLQRLSAEADLDGLVVSHP